MSSLLNMGTKLQIIIETKKYSTHYFIVFMMISDFRGYINQKNNIKKAETS